MEAERPQVACSEHTVLRPELGVEIWAGSSAQNVIMMWLDHKLEKLTWLNRRSARGKGVACHSKQKNRVHQGEVEGS